MKRLFLTVLAIGCLVIQGQTLSAQIDNTLKLIPNNANAISIVNVEKIYGSQMASTEKWIENSKLKYSKSPLYFPTSTQNVVLAAEFDLTHGSVLWEVAFMNMKSPIAMDVVAKLCNGTKDKLSGFEVVDTGGGSTLLKMGDKTLATRFPSNRQQVGRWARAAEGGQTGSLSPYLMNIAKHAKEDDAEIVMGIDLVDVVRQNTLREQLADTKLKASKEDLVKVISSIQGVMFEVRLKSSAQGVLRIDFAEDASALEEDAKDIILHVLKEKGLYIKDLDNWIADVNGKSISYKGRLTSTGLRRVSSIIEPPRIPMSAMDMGTDSVDKGQQAAINTKEHWDAVQALLKDIRNYQPQTRNQLAFYYEKYSRKIDNLPILNVAETELDYAAEVAEILREVAAGRRDVVAKTSATDKQYRGYNYTYNWGASGWYGGGRSAQSASEAASANIIAKGATDKAKLMNSLDDLTSQTRRELTKEFADYQTEF